MAMVAREPVVTPRDAAEPGRDGRPKIGIPNALTCRFQSVRVIEQFLKNVGFVVENAAHHARHPARRHHPCSADFCIPVRAGGAHLPAYRGAPGP